MNGKTEVGNRLHECLPECTMREVEMLTSKAQMLEHQECKTRQIKKFDRLKSKKRDDACQFNYFALRGKTNILQKRFRLYAGVTLSRS